MEVVVQLRVIVAEDDVDGFEDGVWVSVMVSTRLWVGVPEVVCVVVGVPVWLLDQDQAASEVGGDIRFKHLV